MPKILHTARYTGTPWEILKSIVSDEFRVETLDELNYDCLLRQAVDADYFLVSGRLPIDEGVLSAAKHLKMIQRTGVGTEMLDMEAIRKHNIPVYVNAGVNARSVAEHTLTLMLCCLKNIPLIDKNVKQGIWKKQQTGVTCNELFGKTVGLVGMGAIGRQVAGYLKAFGANVIYTDVYRANPKTEQQLALTFVPSFGELLPQVDILSFHCPLTKENKDMLGAKEMSLMRDGAILINTARGKLIDPSVVYDALKVGKLRAAALDVHYEEPIPPDYPIAKLDNVILTPHIGGLTYEAFQQMMWEAVDNIRLFELGKTKEIVEKLLTV